MANTYAQMHAHCVWSVKHRAPLLPAEHREEIHRYITEVVKRRGQKLIAIFCMPNHVHMLIGFRPNIAVSDVVRDVKRESSAFISGKKWTPFKFEWQEGFGCFTCSHADLDNICRYIFNQEEHHKGRTFEEEYRLFMKKYEADFEEKYLFD
ncbi:MAG: IS200/IS605 family transposase [Bacteroidetes bacterium]|nr:MAG: IS200/IS605 family transposase [Bacteroidota bacterium]